MFWCMTFGSQREGGRKKESEKGREWERERERKIAYKIVFLASI